MASFHLAFGEGGSSPIFNSVVVQWIEWGFPKPLIWVRVPAMLQHFQLGLVAQLVRA